MDTVLVTGAAGFLGFHTCKLLIQKGYQVIGVDSLEDDVNTELKIKRLGELGIRLTPGLLGRVLNVVNVRFSFFKSDIRDVDLWALIKEKYQVDQVIHLAIPEAKKEAMEFHRKFSLSHFDGFLHVLDFCADAKVSKLYYAHTSQINFNFVTNPADEIFNVDNEIQLINDYLASVYLKLYNLQAMALDFPQVFGDLNRLDALAHQVFKENMMTVMADPLAENAISSLKFCAVEEITKHVLGLIEDPNPSFDQVACTVGSDYWQDPEELRLMIKP